MMLPHLKDFGSCFFLNWALPELIWWFNRLMSFIPNVNYEAEDKSATMLIAYLFQLNILKVWRLSKYSEAMWLLGQVGLLTNWVFCSSWLLWLKMPQLLSLAVCLTQNSWFVLMNNLWQWKQKNIHYNVHYKIFKSWMSSQELSLPKCLHSAWHSYKALTGSCSAPSVRSNESY